MRTDANANANDPRDAARYKWFNNSSSRKINPITSVGWKQWRIPSISESNDEEVNSKLFEHTRGLQTNKITDYNNLFWCKYWVIKSYNVLIWYMHLQCIYHIWVVARKVLEILLWSVFCSDAARISREGPRGLVFLITDAAPQLFATI